MQQNKVSITLTAKYNSRCSCSCSCMSLMMVDGRDSMRSAILKNILDNLLSNNTDEEIKIILSEQDYIKKTVDNSLVQKYVEEIKLHFDQEIAGMKFYMENSLKELKKNFTREYANMTNKGYVRYYSVL